MDDLEAQLRRLAEHRGAQAADLDASTAPALWIRRRRYLLVAAVVLVVAGGAVGWLVTQNGQGDTVVAAPASTSSTTVATAPPTSTVATRSFESRLGFTVELPAVWSPDTTPVSETFLDALVGPDSGFFRAEGWDRPDRSSFADSTEPNPPDLDQAAQTFAARFPEEFGASPLIEKTSVGLPAGMVIRPSADADNPNGITYLLEPPVWVPFRFVEVVVDESHAVELMDSFTWLPEPAGSRLTETIEAMAQAKDTVVRFVEALRSSDPEAQRLLVSDTYVSDSELDAWTGDNGWLLDDATLEYFAFPPRSDVNVTENVVTVVRPGPQPHATAFVVSGLGSGAADRLILRLQTDGPVPDPPPGTPITTDDFIMFGTIPVGGGVAAYLDGIELESLVNPVDFTTEVHLSRRQMAPDDDTAAITTIFPTTDTSIAVAFAYPIGP